MADEQDLIKSLFTLIENTVFYGDRLGQGQMVSLMSPGQFLSLNLSEARPSDVYVQFDVTDPALDTSFIRKPLTSTLSQQYADIFTFAALPLKQLTPDQQQQLAGATQTVSSLSDPYDQYASAYSRANEDYLTALESGSTDPATLQALGDARNRALQQWNTNNLKATYENAYALMLYLDSGNPITFFQALDQQRGSFYLLDSSGDRYYATKFDPPVASWANASWTHALLDTNTVSSNSYSSSTSWSGGLSAGWGIFSFGGSGGHSETYEHDHAEATTLVADLEYLRVKIERPWLVPDVFGYRFWTWQKTHGFSYLSDGATPPAIPAGTLPMITQEMLVVRKVKLTANFTESDNNVITSHMQAGASFGVGPFSVSGSYSENSSEVKVTGTQNGATIEIDQPQILAFLCSLTPQCPNPDPSLPWQGDAAFPNNVNAQQAREMVARRASFFAAKRRKADSK